MALRRVILSLPPSTIGPPWLDHMKEVKFAGQGYSFALQSRETFLEPITGVPLIAICI